MTLDTSFSFLDIFDLPDLEGELLAHLSRSGTIDTEALAQATGLDLSQVQEGLDALVGQGRARYLADGRVEAVMGRARKKSTLSAEFWNTLQATGRLYSEKEIAVLRTAVPILQFARARMVEFADHGPGHALRVKAFAGQLGYITGLSEAEQELLRAAALFHDVGNAVDREHHNTISQDTVLRLTAEGELPFSSREAEIVGCVCLWHRREYNPKRCDDLDGEKIRTGLLASILRVADAMDIDHRRSDYSERFSWVLRFYYPQSLPYWDSLEQILGVRLHCTPAVHLQAFTRGQVTANMQIAMLRGDLNSTPLDWTIQQIAIGDDLADDLTWLQRPRQRQNGEAVLVFPFEPHSLVMAGLSRKHLLAAGYPVEVLCYPDTASGPEWLWGQALSEIDPDRHEHLVVIGDRPDPGITAQRLETVERWRAEGREVTWLNRHEANWSCLPDLLQKGVKVVLGGDWAYFWGKPEGEADLAWGRIASLLTRDPTYSVVGLTDQEQQIAQGLLKEIYDSSRQPASDADGWATLATPILERIGHDNFSGLAEKADDFVTEYASTSDPGQVIGRVLCFEEALGELPQACYWALEAAIESQGRAAERGIHFNVPYAVATWPDGDGVELLAISHWREEEAIPIRLLYPADVGPPPAGNESTIQVRLTTAQANCVVQALVDACNQGEA